MAVEPTLTGSFTPGPALEERLLAIERALAEMAIRLDALAGAVEDVRTIVTDNFVARPKQGLGHGGIPPDTTGELFQSADIREVAARSGAAKK